MMLIMGIICLLKTLNSYIRLAESLCSVCFIQPYVFQILEENVYDMNNFRGYRSFPGWFQVMSVVSRLVSDSSWMVSGGFRWFQVIPGRSCFSKYI